MSEDRLVRAVLAIRDGLSQIVEQLNDVLKEMAPGGAWVPHIDISELDEAGWLTYHSKEPAPPDTAAWVKNPVHFTSWKDPPPVLLELVKALKRSKDQKLQLGSCVYSFSGKGDLEEHFISRRPLKGNKNG